MEKKCLDCGDTFKGSIDKKFCSDLCRNAYNNKVNSESSNYVRNINGILRKNRKILESLIPEETARASKQKLTDKGFNFGYNTHQYKTKKGDNYFFCYEFGYLAIEGDYFLLVKRKQ